MTSLNTEVKGYFNDPYLHTGGEILKSFGLIK